MSTKRVLSQQEFDKLWESTEVPEIDISGMRNFLIRKIPFYSQALQRVDIVLVDDKKSPSWGYTNGYRVYINPRLYALTGKRVIDEGGTWFSTPILGIAFTILHEIGHIVFDSFGRLEHRDPKMWNIATDYQINQFIVKLMDQSNIFLSAEKFTEFLTVINKNLCFDPAKYELLTSEGTYDDLYRVSVGKSSGSGSDDKALNGDMAPDDDDSLSDDEKMTRDIVKSELSNYVEKNASKLPGRGSGFREFAFLQEPPKINLRTVLKHITDRECSDDWGWNSRGSRLDHLLPNNMRLPVITEMNPDLVKKVCVVLDSSGSVSSEQLNDALNILKECVEKYTRQPVWLIIHTDTVVFSKDIHSHNEITEHFSGGTAFIPVINELKRLRKDEHIEMSAIIWITDLYGEINPSAMDLRGTCKNPNKQFKWLITGSKEEPVCGKYWFLDEIGK